MPILDVVSIASAVLASLGGAGVIILGLSNWLGKIWAERLMQGERHQHSLQLEAFRSSLNEASSQKLKDIEARLAITKEAVIKEHVDRVTIYRAAIDVVAGMLPKVEMILLGKRGELTMEELTQFENDRLRVYGYLAMHAPQAVMDANDQLIELLMEVIFDGKELEWKKIRDSALRMLNEVRKDVGIRPEGVAYNGSR